MQVTLQGFRNLDFKSKDGEQIKGTQLFVTFLDAETTGYMTERLFIRPEVQLPTLKQGDLLDVSFNMRGKVEVVEKSDGKALPKLGN